MHKEIYKEKEMIKFTKMSASGNDFVVIDNREKQILDTGSWMLDFVRKVCKRKMGIGADGVLLIESSSKADFKMRVFNPDGGEVEMCGNGARCCALYMNAKCKMQNALRFAQDTSKDSAE
ncbi:hypothetical protein L6386_05265, partial [bacterium]|nr:hypothetical protein [bacterium]